MCCCHNKVSRGWGEQTPQSAGPGCGLETPSPSQDTLQASSFHFQNSDWLITVVSCIHRLSSFFCGKSRNIPLALSELRNDQQPCLRFMRKQRKHRAQEDILNPFALKLLSGSWTARICQKTSTRPGCISNCRLDWSRENKTQVHPYFR